MKPRARENAEAAALVTAVRVEFPASVGLFMHLGNETVRGGSSPGAYIGAQRARKARGVLTGAADYFLAKPAGGMAGLFLELKAEGGTVKAEQLEFLERMRAAGYGAAVAWGWPSALRAVRHYMTDRSLAIGAHTVLGYTVQLSAPVSEFTLAGAVRRSRVPQRGPLALYPTPAVV